MEGVCTSELVRARGSCVTFDGKNCGDEAMCNVSVILGLEWFHTCAAMGAGLLVIVNLIYV